MTGEGQAVKLTVTFRAADEHGDDHVLGAVTWDGAAAAADPPGNEFLARVARSVAAWPDPAAAVRELPFLYKSAYLRAAVTEGE